MNSTELGCIGAGGVRENRVRVSATDSVPKLVLGAELTFGTDWLPGCLFCVLRSWAVVALSGKVCVYHVQLVVGGTIECTIKAHRWFRVVAWFVQIAVVEINEVDEVKCDE